MFELCNDCLFKLNQFYEGQDVLQSRLEVEISWVKEQVSKDFNLSKHASEKLSLLNLEEDFICTLDLKIIEVQKGFSTSDYKMIFLTPVGLHVIFLYVPGRLPKLINVYNPLEGKNFKWNTDGSKRVYLESFTQCCQHPDLKKFTDNQGFYKSKDYKFRQNEIRRKNGLSQLKIPRPIKVK